MERTAFKDPLPLPCYSTEYLAEDERCCACPHRENCIRDSGRRGKMIALEKADFDFLPREFDDFNTQFLNLKGIYSLAYERVFGKPPKRVQYTMQNPRRALRAMCRAAGLDVENYVLISLMAFDSRNDAGYGFNVDFLFSDANVRQISVYREGVTAISGHFDAATMERTIYKDRTEALPDRLLRSEIVAGTWIIRHLLKHPKKGIRDRLYEAKELQLDPWWLVTETHRNVKESEFSEPEDGDPALKPVLVPTAYGRRYFPWVKAPGGIVKTDLDKHRSEVARIRRTMVREKAVVGRGENRMKAGRGRIRHLYRLRENGFLKALDRVLYEYGYTLAGFEIADKTFTDPLGVWIELGLAISRLKYLQYLEGNQSALF